MPALLGLVILGGCGDSFEPKPLPKGINKEDVTLAPDNGLVYDDLVLLNQIWNAKLDDPKAVIPEFSSKKLPDWMTDKAKLGKFIAVDGTKLFDLLQEVPKHKWEIRFKADFVGKPAAKVSNDAIWMEVVNAGSLRYDGITRRGRVNIIGSK
ncbi:MAG: hypothetical protein JST35_02015 [Armatimonadetes bacterium]|nr:hypothetical protein [Armatimonadota bacterium]